MSTLAQRLHCTEYLVAKESIIAPECQPPRQGRYLALSTCIDVQPDVEAKIEPLACAAWTHVNWYQTYAEAGYVYVA